MSLHEQPALKEKLYIRLGRAAFVLRYEKWQRDSPLPSSPSIPLSCRLWWTILASLERAYIQLFP